MNTKNSTKSKDYADYYLKKFNIWYRKVLPVDVPFSFIAKRACCGKILDIGCGPGRYLKFFTTLFLKLSENGSLMMPYTY
jgi:SAM-dependent methyltransferase